MKEKESSKRQNNPFKHIRSIDLPRDEIASKVLSHLQRNEYVSILAPIQSGKTAFLKQMRKCIDDCIYIDFEGTAYADMRAVALDFFLRVSKYYPDIKSNSDVYSNLDFKNFLEELAKFKGFVFLIDEVCSQRDLALDFLRAVRAYYNENIGAKIIHNFVFAGSTDLTDFTIERNPSISPFNIAIALYLEDFEKEQIQVFIERTGKNTFSDRAIQQIFEYTHGHPFLVQFLCYCLYDFSSKEIEWKLETLPKLLEEFKIEEIVNIRSMIGRIWNNPHTTKQKTERRTDLLWAILKGGQIPFSTIQKDIRDLYLIGCIREKNGYCTIRNPIYETVLNKHFEINKKIKQLYEQEGELVMSERYIDFNLYIAPNGHIIANSPEGQATSDISTQMPNDIRLALQLIEHRQTNTELLKQVGQSLYGWLFPSAIHTHFHQTEARARGEKVKLRLRLRIEAEDIASLPLEFLYRAQGGYFLAVNPDTVLSRYLVLPLPPECVRRREDPLYMLTIIADPTDQTRLNPDEWEAIIKEALTIPLSDGQMTLKTVKRATRKEIRNALLKQKPDIIQFVGHGIYHNGKGYLALVDENTGATWEVDDERFANLYLGYDGHLGLISLATCESAKSNSPQGFLGIAPKLVQRGVPAVVAMQYKVLIKTAKVFQEDFYTAVAARKPIDWAVQSARNAVSQEFGLDNREFATPVLYMRAQDGNVF